MGGSLKSSDVQAAPPLKQCPASLFYQILIVLFAPEPKQFLVESKSYLRPTLFDKTSFSPDSCLP